MQAQRTRLLWTVTAILTMSGTALAGIGPTAIVEQLSKMVRPGDIVTVTECSGSRVTGRLANVSAESVVLVSESAHRSIATNDIIQVQLVRRGEHRLPARKADSGARCQDPACMVVALTFGGATAVRRGFGKLLGSRKTVYRAGGAAECGTRQPGALHDRGRAPAPPRHSGA